MSSNKQHTQHSNIIEGSRDWVENVLSRLHMVEWDRFVVGEENNLVGAYIKVYGWIDREDDAYKDFVIVQFWPNTEDNIVGYTTSSDEYTEDIYRLIYGSEPDDHNPCQRVEDTFDISNAVHLD